jgi:hypothetical protein
MEQVWTMISLVAGLSVLLYLKEWRNSIKIKRLTKQVDRISDYLGELHSTDIKMMEMHTDLLNVMKGLNDRMGRFENKK